MTDIQTEVLTDALRRFEAERVPRPTPISFFVHRDVDAARRVEILFDRNIEQDALALRLMEESAGHDLASRLEAERVRIAADPTYSTAQPNDEVEWPDMEHKQRWHTLNARADVLEQTLSAVCADLRALLA